MNTFTGNSNSPSSRVFAERGQRRSVQCPIPFLPMGCAQLFAQGSCTPSEVRALCSGFGLPRFSQSELPGTTPASTTTARMPQPVIAQQLGGGHCGTSVWLSPGATITTPRTAPHATPRIAPRTALSPCPGSVPPVAPQTSMPRIAPRTAPPVAPQTATPPAAPRAALAVPPIAPHDNPCSPRATPRCGRPAEDRGCPLVAFSSQYLAMTVPEVGNAGTQRGTVGKISPARIGRREIARLPTLFAKSPEKPGVVRSEVRLRKDLRNLTKDSQTENSCAKNSHTTWPPAALRRSTY
jgi:hypothetical protein